MSPAQIRALAKRLGVEAYWGRNEQLWYFWDDRTTLSSEYFPAHWPPQTIKMIASELLDKMAEAVA